MGKKKAVINQPIDSKDIATTFWFCMAAMLPMLGLGVRMCMTIPHRPPLAKTDVYSGYRWARCDTNPRYCEREYNESSTATIIRYAQRSGQAEQGMVQSGVPIILYSTDPGEHFEHKRIVGSKWVYGRVAQELENLRSEGVDPSRLEDLLVSLAQTSSGNVGESIALKRPELEKRYWQQMKAFVRKYPEPDTGNVQELFKGWHKQDPDVQPPPAFMPSLPAFGDFKWRIQQHSTLTADRYRSSVFYAGGYPWRLVYYPRSAPDAAHVSIYLTPAASQLNLPNWTRRVSYNIRIYGHEKPAMSIWANMTNCVFTADTLENGLGFARFTTHATLAIPGRGYLKDDVLEIRAIVRVDAVANMAAPPPNAHIMAGQHSKGYSRSPLHSFLRLPSIALPAVPGGSDNAPCKWCSWQGAKGGDAPEQGSLLPFGLKVGADSWHSLGHGYGECSWAQAALYALVDVLMPCGLAILLCHAAAIPLAISDSIMGQYCPQKLQPLYTALCQMRDAQSVLIGVLVEEGCLCRLLLTSLVSQQLLSRPGLLSLLATQLFAQCLRCLQLQDLEQQRSSAPSSPRSSSAASTQHSLEHLPPDPPPTLWWPMFGMTVLMESMTHFGLPWRLGVPIGVAWMRLKVGLSFTDMVYFHMLPATLVDCLRHDVSSPARVMHSPLVAALQGLAASTRAGSSWGALLMPAEESLHATICSAFAFAWLASVLVPELRLDWKLAAPALALAAHGQPLGAVLAAVSLWEGLKELPPDKSLRQWLRELLVSAPAAVLSSVVLTARQAGAVLTGACRQLPKAFSRAGKAADKALPKGEKANKKPNAAADSKAANKRATNTSPKAAKQKQSGSQGKAAAAGKGSKAKRAADAKPADAAKAVDHKPCQAAAKNGNLANPKGQQEQAQAAPPHVADATATVTINTRASAGTEAAEPKAAPARSQRDLSPMRAPLQPITAKSYNAPHLVAASSESGVLEQKGTQGEAASRASPTAAKAREQVPPPRTAVPVTPPEAVAPVAPPASEALPLPVGLLLPGDQPGVPKMGSNRQQPKPPNPAVAPADLLQQQQLSAILAARKAPVAPDPSPPLQVPSVLTKPQQQCSPEDLLLAVLTGGTRGAPMGNQRIVPLAARLSNPGADSLASLLARSERSITRVAVPSEARAAVSHGDGWADSECDDSDASEDATSCVMCWEKPRQTTLAPCGHRALCTPCTKLLLGQRTPPLCPICRCGVQSYITREFDA